jgi:hypothetical protein
MKKTSTLTLAAIFAAFAGSVAFAQEEAPAPAPAPSSDELAVAEVVIATAVEEHEPVSPGTTFARGSTPLVCFPRIENGPRTPTAVYVAWERAEGDPAEATERGVRLDVPGQRRQRTFIRGSSNRAPGAWRCVVRAEDGRVLGHADFSITE